MKVALAQMDIIFEDNKANQQKVRQMVNEAKSNQADMIIFPELTLSGFSMNPDLVYQHNIATFFQALSSEFQIKIIYGHVFKDGKAYYNRLSIVDENQVLMNYDKIHSFGDERFHYYKGDMIDICHLDDFTFSGFICYDLRFPEVFQLASKKANVIVVIASWPKVRDDHWLTLLKARAIENQVYIIGVNRVGHDDCCTYCGHSVIFDPWGNRINDLYADERIVYGNLDLTAFDIVKNNNYQKDRRMQLYFDLWHILSH